jgi:hypothetical protein
MAHRDLVCLILKSYSPIREIALPAARRFLPASIVLTMAGAVDFSGMASAQAVQDPGVRGGPPGAGGPLPNLIPGGSAPDGGFFAAAKVFFRSVFSVTGSLDDAGRGGINVGVTNGGPGLGPQFNLNSCGGCHAQPVTGGTSPSVNPEVAMATIRGAHNKVPPFITLDGPVRERRGTVPQYIHHQAAMSFPELQT